MTDERQIRNLVVARQLLEQAAQSAGETEAGAITAVLLADLAVETVAKTVIGPRMPSGSKAHDPSLPAVLRELLKLQNGGAPDPTITPIEVRDALELHHERNLVQHDAMVPSEPERGVARARAFSRWAVRTFLDIELDDVSRTWLIRDYQPRARLLLAEDAARRTEYTEAMAQLHVALLGALQAERVLRRSRMGFAMDIRRAVERATGTQGRQRELSRELTSLFVDLEQRVGEVEEVIESASIGADPSELAWFLRVAPVPIMTFGSAPSWFFYDDRPRDRADYVRAYDFILATLLRWQRLPPLAEPTGRPLASDERRVLPDPPPETPAEPPAEQSDNDDLQTPDQEKTPP